MGRMLYFESITALKAGIVSARIFSSACLHVRRGVAQPGRAPGSGPGGRRFKSSLPDQSFICPTRRHGLQNVPAT
jgi:hypothetical protein